MNLKLQLSANLAKYNKYFKVSAGEVEMDYSTPNAFHKRMYGVLVTEEPCKNFVNPVEENIQIFEPVPERDFLNEGEMIA